MIKSRKTFWVIMILVLASSNASTQNMVTIELFPAVFQLPSYIGASYSRQLSENLYLQGGVRHKSISFASGSTSQNTIPAGFFSPQSNSPQYYANYSRPAFHPDAVRLIDQLQATFFSLGPSYHYNKLLNQRLFLATTLRASIDFKKLLFNYQTMQVYGNDGRMQSQLWTEYRGFTSPYLAFDITTAYQTKNNFLMGVNWVFNYLWVFGGLDYNLEADLFFAFSKKF